MPNDYEDDCQCNICEWDCDYWDAKYGCTLCIPRSSCEVVARWQNEKNITAAGLDCKARGGRTR